VPLHDLASAAMRGLWVLAEGTKRRLHNLRIYTKHIITYPFPLFDLLIGTASTYRDNTGGDNSGRNGY
jgi:hypothetical protein